VNGFAEANGANAAIATGAFTHHVLGRINPSPVRLAVRVATCGALTVYSFWVVAPLLFAGVDSINAAKAAASLIAEAGKRGEDRLLVVDRDMLVYIMASAEPPGAIFHPQHLLCQFPARGASRALAASMDSDPPLLWLATRRLSVFVKARVSAPASKRGLPAITAL
jgi:hypothetical protein